MRKTCAMSWFLYIHVCSSRTCVAPLPIWLFRSILYHNTVSIAHRASNQQRQWNNRAASSPYSLAVATSCSIHKNAIRTAATCVWLEIHSWWRSHCGMKWCVYVAVLVLCTILCVLYEYFSFIGVNVSQRYRQSIRAVVSCASVILSPFSSSIPHSPRCDHKPFYVLCSAWLGSAVSLYKCWWWIWRLLFSISPLYNMNWPPSSLTIRRMDSHTCTHTERARCHSLPALSISILYS